MKAKVILQYLVPQHILSRIVGRIAECQVSWLKNALIRWFIKRYSIVMDDVVEPSLEHYKSFNEFFTRQLCVDARPIAPGENEVISPVDGVVSQMGAYSAGTLIQAKGREFAVADLVTSCLINNYPQFREGFFATIYLSPSDYHRIHMPCAGTLKQVIYIPGKLFSVNPLTASSVQNLYARNERAVILFETNRGPMLMVLVGAMLVAGIETVWQGPITPGTKRVIQKWDYSEKGIKFAKGEEIGRFQFGSTSIMLFPQGLIEWQQDLSVAVNLKMGNSVARFVQ